MQTKNAKQWMKEIDSENAWVRKGEKKKRDKGGFEKDSAN